MNVEESNRLKEFRQIKKEIPRYLIKRKGIWRIGNQWAALGCQMPRA